MSFIDKFLAKFYAKKVGEDSFGNIYYLSFFKNYLGKNKRLVIYNGLNLASKVPPMWHSWLHYMSDDIPRDEKSFAWQKNYQPNLTGTKYAYDPSKLSNKERVYNQWRPKKIGIYYASKSS